MNKQEWRRGNEIYFNYLGDMLLVKFEAEEGSKATKDEPPSYDTFYLIELYINKDDDRGECWLEHQSTEQEERITKAAYEWLINDIEEQKI